MTAIPDLVRVRAGRPAPPPALPTARGPLSAAVLTALTGGQAETAALVHAAGSASGAEAAAAEPYGEDLQLALYVLYELHYRGFAGVPEGCEWDPDLLRVRGVLEDRFLSALRRDVPAGRTVADAFGELLLEPVEPAGQHGPGQEESVAAHLQHRGELWQLREYAALRSLYHLKEADPHAWVIPRLEGRAKAAMAAVEYDEFGAGRAENVHARLFAGLMRDLDLDPAYGRYLDAAPAAALPPVNLMSLFGLHRSLRGALIGHFGCVEVTSSPGSRRLAAALRRLEAGPAAQRFYDEHVEADAVHEQVVRREVIGGLLADEPALESDIAFGADATVFLEDRLGAALLECWRVGASALRFSLQPLRPPELSPGTRPLGVPSAWAESPDADADGP
ncbi:iron-containing redox enzyme family protein [Streptomyces oryzae]|uniref:Iron-containing redox enzyme family protein n=1 Tax=Streptomyces oryzae TaxID=1434886 RepID=A0ABS3XJS3_9ACTN|nr:iron-containing redox enzyme family protein [Streptomyces oryzae]MBO8195660.1 iron-containing redox enzyme family protein [Streptomyces oryzae]